MIALFTKVLHLSAGRHPDRRLGLSDRPLEPGGHQRGRAPAPTFAAGAPPNSRTRGILRRASIDDSDTAAQDTTQHLATPGPMLEGSPGATVNVIDDRPHGSPRPARDRGLMRSARTGLASAETGARPARPAESTLKSWPRARSIARMPSLARFLIIGGRSALLGPR
jgi:hypothetical protein